MVGAVADVMAARGQVTLGLKALLPLDTGGSDRTELDLAIIDDGHVTAIAEAKLTESGFTSKHEEVVRSYSAFPEVFDAQMLERDSSGRVMDYQLVRNVLAAHHLKAPFFLIYDERRPDLRARFDQLRRAIVSEELRSRCTPITWQNLASQSPRALAGFLDDKYGVE